MRSFSPEDQLAEKVILLYAVVKYDLAERG